MKKLINVLASFDLHLSTIPSIPSIFMSFCQLKYELIHTTTQYLFVLERKRNKRFEEEFWHPLKEFARLLENFTKKRRQDWKGKINASYLEFRC